MFTTLKAVLADFYRYFSPLTKQGLIRLVVLVGVVGALILFLTGQDNETASATTDESLGTAVSLLRLAEVATDGAFTTIGNVAADAEVDLAAEASGRLTSVNVSLGQSVGAGTVIARIENSAQYAALLQAEGAYEAAQANAAIATVTESEAQLALDKAVADSATTLTTLSSELQALFNDEFDTIFADPNNVYKTPGFLSAYAAPRISYLRTVYPSLEADLSELRTLRSTIATADDSQAVMEAIRTVTNTLSTVLLTVRELLNEDSSTEQFDADEAAFLSTVATAEQSVTSIESRVTAVENSLRQAEDTLEKAQLSAGTEAITTSGAQLKQALGSLRSAQSAYNKTIITSPIAGTVSSLSISTGATVTNGQVVATITNDEAFEIITFVTEAQARQLAVGDTVLLDEAPGIVQSISPSISRQTGKVEVRIQSTADTLTSGDTVTVTFSPTVTDSSNNDVATTLLPLTAVKLSNQNASVYTVADDNTLTAHPVTLGRPQGSMVVVTEGLEELTTVVEDVRGLVAGQAVTVQ
jgi:RND family efflux transporter MFP subunit